MICGLDPVKRKAPQGGLLSMSLQLAFRSRYGITFRTPYETTEGTSEEVTL